MQPFSIVERAREREREGKQVVKAVARVLREGNVCVEEEMMERVVQGGIHLECM